MTNDYTRRLDPITYRSHTDATVTTLANYHHPTSDRYVFK